MKKLTTMLIIICTFGVLFANPIHAFSPEEEMVFVIVLSSEESNVAVGTLINISIIIKNLTDNPIHNITVIEKLPISIEFIQTPYGLFNGTEANYTGFSFVNQINNENIQANYLNSTASNFTLNFNEIRKSETLSIGFIINVTQVGTALTLDKTIVEYYDHWGDKNRVSPGKINSLGFDVREIPQYQKGKYFPDVKVEEVDYQIIILIFISVLVLALSGRILYKKKPFEV